MKSVLVITLLLMLQGPVFGQTTLQAKPATLQANQKTEASEEQKFEAYCLANALQLITVPAEKAGGIAVAGEVALLGGNASYRDYGITLKENEVQYYRITGSDQLLMAKSLYRLRVAYNSEHQKR